MYSNRNDKMMSEMMGVDLYTIPGKEKILMTGKIVPKQSENITVPSGFTDVDKMNVKDGQVVKKGDLLFSCKNEETINELGSLNTTLANKKKELGNTEDEEVKAAINAEISEFNTQIANLNKKTYKSVYAPFSGKIYMQSGEANAEGQVGPLMVLETTEYYIKTQTNEMDIVKLAMDQEVDITVTSTKEKIKGKIAFIGDRPVEGGDTNSEYGGGGTSFANFDIKVMTEVQDKLKNGFGVQIIAQFGKGEYKVPVSAVIEEEGKHYVFKIVDDIATKTEIKVKEQKDDFFVVDGGIGEEDIIARDTMDSRIVDGQNIYEDAQGQNMNESGTSQNISGGAEAK